MYGIGEDVLSIGDQSITVKPAKYQELVPKLYGKVYCCLCVCLCARACACIFVHILVCTCVCLCMHMCMCICIYMCVLTIIKK